MTEALAKALEPFADIDGEGDEDLHDTMPVTVKFGRTTYYALTLGDLRAARAALSEYRTKGGCARCTETADRISALFALDFDTDKSSEDYRSGFADCLQLVVACLESDDPLPLPSPETSK